MDRMTRLVVSTFLVLAACGVSYRVARGARKGFSPTRPPSACRAPRTPR
ncbi:MAG: hypothetical protein M0D55_15600 [Elusimicrobiota bacterium]|nr:MAG: hypothetical protein M0D55_15600 [Elusimicrobiota bacterium]